MTLQLKSDIPDSQWYPLSFIWVTLRKISSFSHIKGRNCFLRINPVCLFGQEGLESAVTIQTESSCCKGIKSGAWFSHISHSVPENYLEWVMNSFNFYLFFYETIIDQSSLPYFISPPFSLFFLLFSMGSHFYSEIKILIL